MQRNWPLIIFLLFVSGLSAQQQNSLLNRGVVEVSYQPGIVTPHHKSIQLFLDEPVQGFDINFGLRTDGSKPYHENYRYPVNGLGFYYTSLGNSEIYGNALALYGFAKVPVRLNSKQWKIDYRIALGLSYLTKIFDLNENYRNIAIGSHVNVYARTSMRLTFQSKAEYSFFTDAGFCHMSNGLIKSPNYGLNLLTVSGGMVYNLSSALSKVDPEPEVFNKNNFSVFISGGVKTKNNFEDTREPVASINASYERQVNSKRMFGGGVDIFYDKTLFETIELKKNIDVEQYMLYRMGIHALHEALYGKLAVTTQLGYYLYSEYDEISRLYSRIGVRYNVFDNVWGHVAVKAHNAVADFVEWGVGYRFNQ